MAVDSMDLKCIRVERDGKFDGYLTWNQFNRSFMAERWENERRYDTRQTLWGFAHRRMTVRFDAQSPLTRRVFTFPKSMEEAKKLHEENAK